jgi:hypothetical protein
MPRETPSPVDLPDPLVEDADGLAWTTVTIAVAALLLLAINAVSLKDWVDGLRPSPLQARAAIVADRWLAITREAGVAAPRDALHGLWQQAEDARFGSAAR